MKKFFSLFKAIKWWEGLFLVLSYCLIIILGIVFKSNVLIVLNSILGVSTSFFLSKGMLIANFVGIIQLALYSSICFFNSYYGEIVSCVLISFPTYIFSIITWTRNRAKGSGILKVNKSPSLLEWIVSLLVLSGLSIGLYFMLRAFNTANLLFSTASLTFATMAGYLMIRRSEYNFVFYILNNITCLVMWWSVVSLGDVGYIPTFANYFIYLIANLYGTFNWIRLKKLQNLRKRKNMLRQEYIQMNKSEDKYIEGEI